MQSQEYAEEKERRIVEDPIVEELKKIEVLLTPAQAPKAGKGMRNEFMFFLQQYKVLGLAVAFIMGIYLGAVVLALVEDLIMPAIGLIFPGMGNLASLSVTVGSQVFGLGAFAVAVLTFAIVAVVIFMIVKIATRWGLNK